MGIKDTKIHLCAINLVFPTKPCIIASDWLHSQPHIQNIYNLCLFCVFYAIRLTLHYLFTPAWVYIWWKKKETKMGIMCGWWSTHTFIADCRSFGMFFFFFRYEANAKWIQMNSLRNEIGGWKMRRANIHKCICVYVCIIYAEWEFYTACIKRCWAYMCLQE